MKNTSIDWLINQIYENEKLFMSGNGNVLDDLLQEAKQRHKDETLSFTNEWFQNYGGFAGTTIEEHYNKTFEIDMDKKLTAVEWLEKEFIKLESTTGVHGVMYELLEKAKEIEKEQSKIDENTSDGFHTFKELYDVRMSLNAALFNQWAKFDISTYDVHKSWKHNDGELCFGGGWFIVCAKTPFGQISFHYPESEWEYFNIPEVEKAKYPFDGHTTKDVIARLLNL